jgi:hypothetical protein
LNLGPESPTNLVFGGGASSTSIHPLILAATLIAVLMLLFAPRKMLSFPFLLLIFLGSIGQQVYVAGFHFYVLRILIIAGIFRMIVAKLKSKEPVLVGGFESIDKLFVMWACCRALANVLVVNGEPGAIIYQAGFLIDSIGGFLFVRFLIRNEEDILRVIKIFAALTVIFAITMSVEKFRGLNIFGYLGIVSVIPGSREGSIRAAGAFAHPILAGVFGVAVMPLFWWLRQSGKAKVAGLLGLCGSMGMMVMSASSTPLMSFVAAIIAGFAFPFRNKMRTVRWAVVIILIALHLVMKAPVWMLIARVDVVAGSSGYHRAMLVDQCIRHFTDWWLIGTTAAGSWGWDIWDSSNQFVQEAESGGLITFILFIMIISRSFRKIGTARKLVEDDPQHERFMWCLSVTLFTTCVCFFGVSFFDHTKIMWFAFLAIITAATAPILALANTNEPATEPYAVPLRPAFPSRLKEVTSTRDKTLQSTNRMRLS